MANDGGLRAVLDTSDMVSRQLLALGQGWNKNRHIRQDQEVHELAEKTANALEVNDDSVRSGTKRAASRTLSELSYDFSPKKKMNLSVNTSQELMEVVSPLITKMEAIDAAALLSLNPSSKADGARLDSKGERTVPPIHDRITPSYANDGSSNIVRYLHVKEVPNKYSAGIFVFPPNAEIPLHDHPDMVVLSRVLYGEMKVHSYDVVSPGDDITCDPCQEEKVPPPSASNESKERQEAVPPKKSVFRSSLKAIKDFIQSSFQDEDSSTHIESDSDGSNRLKRSGGPNVLQAKVNQSPMGVEHYQTDGGPLNILTAPHVTCLFPKEGNCHSFKAGPHGAAVLDVLFPPYDGDDGRDCTFFQAKEASSLHLKTQEQSFDKEFTLIPINQPEHFHCLSGVYGRFTTCDEVSEDENESEIVGIDVSVCTSS
jgi:hypothetical protein